MRETGNVSAAVTAVSPRGEDSRGVVALTMVYSLVLATEESARLVPIVKPGRASFFLQTLHGGWWRGWSKSYSKSQNRTRLDDQKLALGSTLGDGFHLIDFARGWLTKMDGDGSNWKLEPCLGVPSAGESATELLCKLLCQT